MMAGSRSHSRGLRKAERPSSPGGFAPQRAPHHHSPTISGTQVIAAVRPDAHSGAPMSQQPDQQRLHAAAREARDDAAPFALAAAAILIALALVSRHAHWESLGEPLWWM